MASREQLESALEKATAAGDNEAINIIQTALEELRTDNVKQEFSEMSESGKALQAFTDVLRLGSSGITFGLRDRIAPVFTGRTVEEERALTQDARDRAGSASLAAEIAPQLALLSGIPAAGGTAARNTAQRGGGKVAQLLTGGSAAASEGALVGALNAYGHGENIPDAMTSGAVFGAGGKIAADSLAKAGNKLSNVVRKKPHRMTVEELRMSKNNAYHDLEDLGVEFKPNSVERLTKEIERAGADTLTNSSATANAAKRVTKALKAEGPLSLARLDKMRGRVEREISNLPHPGEARVGRNMTKAVDNFLDTAELADITTRSGDLNRGMDLLDTARDLNSRYRKLEALDAIMDSSERASAKSLSTTTDAAVRNKVNSLLDSPKKTRGFKPDEMQAMHDLVMGTTTQNALRQAGRMAPGSGTPSLMATAAGGSAGMAIGGYPGAMIGGATPLAAGFLAKRAAERSTAKSTQELLDLIASGGVASRMKSPDLVGLADAQAIQRALMLLGINQD